MGMGMGMGMGQDVQGEDKDGQRYGTVPYCTGGGVDPRG